MRVKREALKEQSHLSNQRAVLDHGGLSLRGQTLSAVDGSLVGRQCHTNEASFQRQESIRKGFSIDGKPCWLPESVGDRQCRTPKGIKGHTFTVKARSTAIRQGSTKEEQAIWRGIMRCRLGEQHGLVASVLRPVTSETKASSAE